MQRSRLPARDNKSIDVKLMSASTNGARFGANRVPLDVRISFFAPAMLCQHTRLVYDGGWPSGRTSGRVKIFIAVPGSAFVVPKLLNGG
jgi:hypothetical protein